MNLFGILLTWLVITLSLIIVSKLPTGVEIESVEKAAFTAVIFGILNALVYPVLAFLTLPARIIFSGFLISLLLNIVIFALVAYLVDGFTLRWGFLSIIIGSVSLSIISFLLQRLPIFSIA